MASQFIDHVKTISPLLLTLGFVGLTTVVLAVTTAAIADWTAAPKRAYRKRALDEWNQ